MPKYYVKSGQIKFIIDARNPISAIKKTIKFYLNKNHKPMRSSKICVSEIGFDSFKSWTCFDSKDFT